ncbi:MAG: barstar family protein, partial [Chloroflexota bacterium]|nr:barstar family protein [Chloroflexota bacterium]
VSDFVWFRQAMPWLGPGFVYCVHEDALDILRGDLARHRFNIVSLDGTAMTDGPSFHAEAKRAFGFPDYYGSNWDAFNDCLGETRLAHPTAILWSAAEVLVSSDLKTFAEAIAEFSRFRDAFKRADPRTVEVADPVQVELLLLGRGKGFRRPDDPIAPSWQRLPL